VSVWLSLGVVLAAAAVVIVALPFLRRPGITAAEDRLDEPDELERRRLELAEERDRVLAALKELEFDHRTGKVSDEDYRALVGPLRKRAAEALRALEPRSREADAEGKVRAPG
jgi:histidinol-phosphate/aromatic aminotransferase/cobyric acid decarboxylase-like protein